MVKKCVRPFRHWPTVNITTNGVEIKFLKADILYFLWLVWIGLHFSNKHLCLSKAVMLSAKNIDPYQSTTVFRAVHDSLKVWFLQAGSLKCYFKEDWKAHFQVPRSENDIFP